MYGYLANVVMQMNGHGAWYLSKLIVDILLMHWFTSRVQLATSPEQRAKHPWIITMAHRPMYCASTDDSDDCTRELGIVSLLNSK